MKRRWYLVLTLLAVSLLLMTGAASRVNATGPILSLVGTTAAIVAMIGLVLHLYFLVIRPLSGYQIRTPGKSGLLVKKEDRKIGK